LGDLLLQMSSSLDSTEATACCKKPHPDLGLAAMVQECNSIIYRSQSLTMMSTTGIRMSKGTVRSASMRRAVKPSTWQLMRTQSNGWLWHKMWTRFRREDNLIGLNRRRWGKDGACPADVKPRIPAARASATCTRSSCTKRLCGALTYRDAYFPFISTPIHALQARPMAVIA
jgi:hypothetical protein